jgi:hypothetical protein
MVIFPSDNKHLFELAHVSASGSRISAIGPRAGDKAADGLNLTASVDSEPPQNYTTRTDAGKCDFTFYKSETFEYGEHTLNLSYTGFVGEPWSMVLSKFQVEGSVEVLPETG